MIDQGSYCCTGQQRMQTGLRRQPILWERLPEGPNNLLENALTKNFKKCQPMYFKGTDGSSQLTPNLVVKDRLCIPHKQLLYLRKKMADKYCLRNEMKKLEVELWNLKVKVKRFVVGFSRKDSSHMAVDLWRQNQKPLQEATEMATELMDKKINTFAERQAENKRKLDNNRQAQQQLPKRQNVARAYATGTSERKEYAGTIPLCNKCKFHHNGPCTVKCSNCKRVGHLTRDCWSSAATNNQRTLTCYECGNPGHYRSDCHELKNQNYENQAEGTGARGMVHALGRGETNQDLNDIEEDINA
ncbi:RNA-directed DNA polymerase, eukaryota [Tanacetum coccineum]|uniref:RNA-directed DNA polymerase, eukaryota n=1 Tax=Tanacetum coccineum TaxID=301880 RepID=A0ABQ5GQ79_9ASTR